MPATHKAVSEIPAKLQRVDSSSEHVEQLRRFARIEREAVMELRGRAGEDPLVTLAELPSVDELVVRELRDEMLETNGQFAEFMMARLAAGGSGEDANEHRMNTDRVEFELLGKIAETYPELSVAAWNVAGTLRRS